MPAISSCTTVPQSAILWGTFVSNEAYYPNLILGEVSKVRIALDQLDADPLWLDRDGCPFDEALILALRGLWGRVRAKRAPKAEVEEKGAEGGMAWDDVTAEARALFEDIREMRTEMNGGMGDEASDPSARVAYYRMAATTLEKVVQLGERAQNIKEVSDFKRRVLDVFDQVLEPEQRTRATELLAQ